MHKHPREKGLTLIEVLVVVILLGILAAVTLPQFAGASEDATRAAARANRQRLQKQIDAFKAEHGYLPGDTSPNKDGSSFDPDRVVDDLTTVTIVAGKELGPYLHEFPENPLAPRDHRRTVSVDAVKPAGGAGWWFQTAMGRVEAIPEPD